MRTSKIFITAILLMMTAVVASAKDYDFSILLLSDSGSSSNVSLHYTGTHLKIVSCNFDSGNVNTIIESKISNVECCDIDDEEVIFFYNNGETIAVVTLSADQMKGSILWRKNGKDYGTPDKFIDSKYRSAFGALKKSMATSKR